MYEAKRLHIMHTVYMSTSGIEMVNFPSHKLKFSLTHAWLYTLGLCK